MRQLYFHNLACNEGEGYLMFLMSNITHLYSILHLQISLKSILFLFFILKLLQRKSWNYCHCIERIINCGPNLMRIESSIWLLSNSLGIWKVHYYLSLLTYLFPDMLFCLKYFNVLTFSAQRTFLSVHKSLYKLDPALWVSLFSSKPSS